MYSNKKKMIAWHCAGWLVYELYDNLYTFLFADELGKAGQLQGELLFTVFQLAVSIFTFYTLVACLKLFLKGKVFFSLLGILSVLIAAYFLSLFAIYLFSVLHIRDALPKDEFNRSLLLSTFQFFIPFFVYAFAYVLAMANINKQSQIVRLQTAQRKIENEKNEMNIQNISLQNAFLRAHINPHFLYNTLNFFYARSLPYSDELADGILTLSEIMRYSLQSQEDDELQSVPLRNEINHIENIIKINKLRFKNNLFINYKVAGDAKSITIVPLALITIIENVFKHGEINSANNPAIIKITIDDSSIQLYCFNKKKGGLKEPSTGIGIENTKQRLEYAYKNNFSLTIKDEECFFTTELNITYNPANKI